LNIDLLIEGALNNAKHIKKIYPKTVKRLTVIFLSEVIPSTAEIMSVPTTDMVTIIKKLWNANAARDFR